MAAQRGIVCELVEGVDPLAVVAREEARADGEIPCRYRNEAEPRQLRQCHWRAAPGRSGRTAPRYRPGHRNAPREEESGSWRKGSKSPISRVLCPAARLGRAAGHGHSSGTGVAAGLEQPTRGSRPGEPERAGRAARAAIPLFGLAPHGVCLAPDRRRPGGALLPRRFTLTLPEGGAVCFLLHFPSHHCASPLASMPPVGVRTFLSTRTWSDRAGLFDRRHDSTRGAGQPSRRRKIRPNKPLSDS